MELVIPIDGHIGLELTVDVGGRTEIVRCSSGAEKLKNVIVEPAGSYEISFVSPAASAHIKNIERICKGLTTDYATVFGEIHKPGRQLALRVFELSIGKTYALIWPASLELEFPPTLDYVRLKSRPGWEGALVTLLHPMEASVQDWLYRFTGLDVTTTVPEIVPVWPPLVRRVTGSLVELPAKSALVVSAGRLTPAGTIGANALFARSVTGETGQNSKLASEPFFHIVPGGDAPIELTCLDPARASLNIYIVAPPKYSEQCAVELAGVANNGVSHSVGLHEGAAADLLESLRNRTVVLSYLSIPKHVTGHASIGRNGLWERRLELVGSDTQAPYGNGSSLLCSDYTIKLAEIFVNKSYDVLLDFGAFGRVISFGDGASAPIPALSRGLRDRLLAYLFQTRRRIAPRLSARQASDTEIIAEFLKEPSATADATWRSLKSVLELEVRTG
ncbi:hypothetical protein ACRS2S_05500 [Achromobacter xylosoxidans]|uniref:hypothetical protein n=1 Tax=Alcaligenes xylosoxydans xylosoxydans TaxID=85698 RepID=UPI003EDF8131